MAVFENISNVLKNWGDKTRLPQSTARSANQVLTPKELERFIEGVQKEQKNFGENMLFAHDMPSIFARARMNASWTNASADLSVFRAVLERVGHSGVCLWFDGKEAPPEIALGRRGKTPLSRAFAG